MDTSGDVHALLEERPDLEPALEAILEPDPPFTFADLPIESGPFGELVSRGIVEKTGDGYRVTDPESVRRALHGDDPEPAPPSMPSMSISFPRERRLEFAYLVGAVAVVVALRLTSLPTVYYDGHVVLAGNDPYYYRYLVEQLLSDPTVTPSNLGFGVSKGEPLLIVSLWWLTGVFGGTVSAAGHLLAWYPIVSAIITAILLYGISVLVTDDRRIGLAAVLMLAIIPGHALRTSLGFADHHAFDFLWLALALFGLTLIVHETDRWKLLPTGRTIIGIVALALAVPAQTLAWDNSPIILAAIGGYLAIEALRSVSSDRRPYRTIAPIVVGVGLGAGLAWIGHRDLGWHTTLVASAPTLLFVGGLGVLIGAELVDRIPFPSVGTDPARDVAPVIFGLLEVVGLVVGVSLLQRTRPEIWTRLSTSVEGRLLARREIAETFGLFSDAGGWLLLLGLALFLGVPYLVWATTRSSADGRWLPPVAYAWYFLGLASIQVRFVGELAVPLALFAGFGLLHLADRIDAARRPQPFQTENPPSLTLPDSRQVVSFVLLFLMVGSLGIIQVPVKTSQTTIPNAQADAAFWMASYNETHDMQWPSNYVFSEWDRNRMYNYFVNGESRSYGYAQSNYESFVTSTEPAGWYERLGNRRGFIVTTSEVVNGPRQLGTRLHRDNGAGSDSTAALARYRLVHVTGDGAYKVFTVVPGAVISGGTAPNSTVTARTRVTVQSRSFSYERRAESDASGRYLVRVAYPGRYVVANSTVRVNESAVRNGLTVTAG